MTQEKTATLKNGIKVKVYKHKLSNNWINSNDCTTQYNPNDITLQ